MICDSQWISYGFAVIKQSLREKHDMYRWLMRSIQVIAAGLPDFHGKTYPVATQNQPNHISIEVQGGKNS